MSPTATALIHLYSVARDGAACGFYDPSIQPCGAVLSYVTSAMDPALLMITCPECAAIASAELARS